MATGRLVRAAARATAPTGRLVRASATSTTGTTGRLTRAGARATLAVNLVQTVEPYAAITLPGGTALTVDSDGFMQYPSSFVQDSEGNFIIPSDYTVDANGLISGGSDWTQTGGPTVSVPSFTAPAGPTGFTLTFTGASATATITVLPHTRFRLVSGQWQPYQVRTITA